MEESRELMRLRSQLVELQSQLAFQEDTLGALDAVVTRQQRQIERLLALWEAQSLQLEQITSALEQDVADDPPPHY